VTASFVPSVIPSAALVGGVHGRVVRDRRPAADRIMVHALGWSRGNVAVTQPQG
jgi:hypothetical protein